MEDIVGFMRELIKKNAYLFFMLFIPVLLLLPAVIVAYIYGEYFKSDGDIYFYVTIWLALCGVYGGSKLIESYKEFVEEFLDSDFNMLDFVWGVPLLISIYIFQSDFIEKSYSEVIDYTQNKYNKTVMSYKTPKKITEQKTAKFGNAIYTRMPRPFVFNTPSTLGVIRMKFEIVLLVRNDESAKELKRYIPLIEGKIIREVSGIDGNDLKYKWFHEALKEDLLQATQEIMFEVTGSQHIEKVIMTDFVAQR